jgi:hypothetical protein
MVPEGGISFHSGVNTSGLKNKGGRPTLTTYKLITSGPFEGYKCWGPYCYQRKAKRSQFYYKLQKDNEKKIAINEADIDLETLQEVRENKKPFIDWLGPWKN